MADKRLDQTTNASAVAAADNIPFVTAAGVTSYVTGDELAASAPFSSRYKPLASDRRFLQPGVFETTVGTPTKGTLGNATSGVRRIGAILFPASGDTVIVGTFMWPVGWSTATAHLWWSNAGAGAGAVYWFVTVDEFADGESTDKTGTTILNAAVTAPAQYVALRTNLGSAFSGTTGEVVRFTVQRAGDVAGDTLGNNCGLLGIELVRAS